MTRNNLKYDHRQNHTIAFISGAVSYAILIAGITGSLPQLYNSWAQRLLITAVDILSSPSLIAIGLAAVISTATLYAITRLNALSQQRALPPKASETSSADNSSSQKMEVFSRQLEEQIADIARFVNLYLEASLGQSEAVAQAHCTISKADTLEQVRLAVETLVQVNAKTVRDAEELRDNLRESQKQAECLRSKLASVEQLALTDGLTQVANRRRFDDFLARALHRSHLDQTPLTLVVADLDHFKLVNDRFGHPTGDAVLKKFASMLSQNVRSNDLIARLGGEEFAVVLPNTPVGNASAMVERIQRQMSITCWYSTDDTPEIGPITASFGITEVIDNDSCDDIIKRADEVLYHAKRNGRNRFEISAGKKPISASI